MSSTLPLVEETKFLIPIVTILGISVLLTVIIQKLKLNFIPTFVIEIIVGIVLKQLFYDSSYKIEYNGVVEVIGRIVIPIALTMIPLIGVWGIWWSAGIVWVVSAAFSIWRYMSWKKKIF